MSPFIEELKPVLDTYIFQIKRFWKRFIVFSLMSLIPILLISILPYTLIPDNPLPNTQLQFFQGGLSFLSTILIFAVCFFFAEIICSEYSSKTGFIIFPKVNKYKLIMGKYLGSFTLVFGVISISYLTIGIMGMILYEEPIHGLLFFSFGMALLYTLAISGIVTLLSSILNSTTATIIISIIGIFMVLDMVDTFIVLGMMDFEPVYSLPYNGNLIISILQDPYPTEISERYIDMTLEGFTFRTWITPEITKGVLVLLTYSAVCLVFASIFFKRRQL